MSKTLVLFDIDGTLLDTRGAGRRSFARAIGHVFGGDDDLMDITFAGATDLDLFEKIARRKGRAASDGERREFFGVLPGLLRDELKEEAPHVYPGVIELLNDLSGRPQITLGLVTGNMESCATIKLEACGIHHRFVLGAFGHEHADRRELARLARRRAEERGAFEHCALIGDTPSDIIAAKEIGAVSIAVATGGYSIGQLAEAGAQVVWTNLLQYFENEFQSLFENTP
ncbi:MAG: haloacid dehalogenase-like hydrolase [Kiritimatiellae bacterium]|nr:haloacid dehalogenase-like hydrolase [Kiritimatiellia bacterium]